MAQDYLYGYEYSADQALFQLDFYLKALELPFSVKDLYRQAYQKRLGPHYSEDWLDDLEHDPDVQAGMELPFTTQTIISTLMRNGYDAIVRHLLRETRRIGIGYVETTMTGIRKWK